MASLRTRNNPWLELTTSRPFVLPEDKPYILELNRSRAHNDSQCIQLNLPPTPFIGSTSAPVVILLANPGVGAGDEREQTTHSALEQIYAGFQKGRAAPFWPLLDSFEMTGAGKWWSSKTRDLANEIGGKRQLAKKLQAIEVHGYHSQKWAPPVSNLPSQGYGFELVRRAMDRDAFIIIGRARGYWYSAVPELRRYPRHVPSLVSTQSAYLSRANLGVNFRKVIKAFES